VKAIELPAGVLLEVELQSRIGYGKTAVGDVVTAEVARVAKIPELGEIPKRARLSGRVVQLVKYGERYVLGIRFDELEYPGVLARTRAWATGLQTVPFPRYSVAPDERTGEQRLVILSRTDLVLSKGVRLDVLTGHIRGQK
jgi:hypothetical protein